MWRWVSPTRSAILTRPSIMHFEVASLSKRTSLGTVFSFPAWCKQIHAPTGTVERRPTRRKVNQKRNFKMHPAGCDGLKQTERFPADIIASHRLSRDPTLKGHPQVLHAAVVWVQLTTARSFHAAKRVLVAKLDLVAKLFRTFAAFLLFSTRSHGGSETRLGGNQNTRPVSVSFPPPIVHRTQSKLHQS